MAVTYIWNDNERSENFKSYNLKLSYWPWYRKLKQSIHDIDDDNLKGSVQSSTEHTHSHKHNDGGNQGGKGTIPKLVESPWIKQMVILVINWKTFFLQIILTKSIPMPCFHISLGDLFYIMATLNI